MEVIVKLTENSLPEAKASPEFSWPHLYFQLIQKIFFLINLQLLKKGDPASGDLSWKTCDTFVIFW